MTYKQRTCDKGVAAGVRKQAFLTAGTGQRVEDGIDASGTETTAGSICMAFSAAITREN